VQADRIAAERHELFLNARHEMPYPN
jgi:hypothetical protein